MYFRRNKNRILKNISELDFKAVEMNKMQPLIKTMFIFSSVTGMYNRGMCLCKEKSQLGAIVFGSFRMGFRAKNPHVSSKHVY